MKRLRVPENLRGLLACGVIFAVMALITDDLASAENCRSIGSATIPLFLLALGQMAVMISGGIELSVTATMALASVMGAAVMRDTGSAAAGVAVMLGVGAAVGLANGAAVARLRLPPFMVTLITMMFFSGAAVRAVESKNISGLAAGFLTLGKSLPVAAGMALGAGMIVHVLLRHTVWGRSLRAVGYNSCAAAFAGLRTGQTVALTYVLSGVLAGLAAVIYTARLETGSPVLGQRMLLDVVGAAVIGGISLTGRALFFQAP